MKRHGRSGERFLTLTFFRKPPKKPLNLAAFKNPKSGTWEIMFRRRQAKR
jgi:hypothetical protein